MNNLKLQIILDTVDRITKPFKRMQNSTSKLQTAFAETTQKLSKLEDSTRQLGEYTRLKETLNQNSDALAKAQEKAQALARQTGSTQKATKALNRQFEAARKTVLKLKEQQSGYQGKLSTLRGKLDQAGISTKNLALSEKKLQKNIKLTNTDLLKQASALDKVTAKTKKMAIAKAKYQKTLAMSANMTFVGGAGLSSGKKLLSGVGSMLQPGMAFEESMSKVGALARVDKTSEQFQKLNSLAKELGATTSFSASEAAQGMGFLAMAGFETNAILETMPGMLNLAKASAMDLGSTADIASNILSGFGLESTEMGRVSDVLAATFSRSNVDLGMLGDTMKYVAPIAKELNVSIEEAAAMSGLLGNIGIQGAQAGTALRAIHSRLAAPPKMAAAAIKQIGLSTMDATGNMRPMVDILADIAAKTKNMGNAERLGIFKHIAGEEAGTAFSELVNKGGADAISKFTKILEASNGEAKRIADTMGDNAMGDLKGLNSAWEAINITLTATNNGPMRELIQMGTDILRNINNWIAENPKLAATLVKIAAVVGGLMVAVGGLAFGLAGILGPLALVKLALVAMNVAALLNPFGLLAIAVVATAGLIYAYWEPIKEFLGTLFTDPLEAGMQFLTTLWDFWKGFGNTIMEIGGWIGSLFGDDIAIKAETIVAPMKKIQSAAVVTAGALVASPAAAGTSQAINTQATAPMHQTIEINIHAAGGDGNEIARIVRQEIEAINRDNAARNRSRLSD